MDNLPTIIGVLFVAIGGTVLMGSILKGTAEEIHAWHKFCDSDEAKRKGGCVTDY